MDPTWLFASLVCSSIGSGIAIYGYRKRDLTTALFGVALILICYVVRSPGALILCNLLLSGVYVVFKRHFS